LKLNTIPPVPQELSAYVTVTTAFPGVVTAVHKNPFFQEKIRRNKCLTHLMYIEA